MSTNYELSPPKQERRADKNARHCRIKSGLRPPNPSLTPITTTSACGWQHGRSAEKIAGIQRSFAGVSPVTGRCTGLNYISCGEAGLAEKRERVMISLGIGTMRVRRLPLWSKLAALVAAWRRRDRFRCDVERLSERDLADMRLTRLDAVNETEKPFWQA